VYYEKFLFTRNQKRDFTAFIRPAGLTNTDISTISSALSHVQNLGDLTPAWPALYCFPIGDYILLLRHYSSRRTHAGRSIGVLEGIGVKQSLRRHFSLAVPHFLAHQESLLAVADGVDDIEALTMQASAQFDWPDVQAPDAVEGAPDDDDLINEFAERLAQDRLFIPFNQDGRLMLFSALADQRLPALYFAFGTNADVLARLNQAAIAVDVVSYFNTSVPSLRSRETNEITSELADYVPRLPTRPLRQAGPLADETELPDLPESMQTPRQMARSAPRDPADDPLAKYNSTDDPMLTPREMARRQREAEAETDSQAEDAQNLIDWLGGLISRLLGRR
jgi:hypothetical protein